MRRGLFCLIDTGVILNRLEQTGSGIRREKLKVTPNPALNPAVGTVCQNLFQEIRGLVGGALGEGLHDQAEVQLQAFLARLKDLANQADNTGVFGERALLQVFCQREQTN